ncbi:MAG: tyrosine-type recombinase/integrase [Sulfitobacter sp.]
MENPLAPEIRAQLYAHRKSFTRAQEEAVLKAAQGFPEDIRLLCELLYVTGCRISEALELRRDYLDTDEALVVFRTLKQRDRQILRAVPVPQSFVLRLAALEVGADGRMWPFSRWTGGRRIKEVLKAAGIPESLANSKTFRHSYNDRGKLHGTPDYVRRALLGHRTQAANDHYGALVGSELRDYARQAWGVLARL